MVKKSERKPEVSHPHKQTPVRAGSITSDENLVRSLDDSEEVAEEKDMKKTMWGVYLVLVVLGIGTGYLLARNMSYAASSSSAGGVLGGSEKTVGVSDSKSFPDSAEGTLEEGGLDGEGTHHLIRDGGPSQTVYLVSSVVDMSQFNGKKVVVWGQTMTAKKAPWLMDVGKIELK